MPITKKIQQTPAPLVFFSDLDFNLTMNPGNKDLLILLNSQAISRAVQNLVLLNFGEKRFNPSVGSGVRGRLFDLATPDTAGQIQTAIETVISNFEPRVQLQSVIVTPTIDGDGYNVVITFFLRSALSTLQTVSFFLQRVR